MESREERAKHYREASTAPPRLTILSDLPLENKEAYLDTFDLDFRFGPVFDILRHPKTRPPMAIAVYGDWGTGKTSAMRWLDDKLQVWSKDGKPAEDTKKIGVRTVWFYPWKYHSKEDVWRGLISEVIIRSIDVEHATMATVTSAAKRFAGFLGQSFVQVLANIKLKATVPGAEGELSLSAIQDILGEYREAAHPEKAFLNEFEAMLKSWIDESLGADERMVIFIDDLDRCLPDVALEVLEALKLYLNIDKLFFVVGIDRTVVQQLVAGHYEKLGLDKEKSAQYLAKMFQVEVPVEPSEGQTETYLSEQLGKIELWSDLSEDEQAIFRQIILNLAVFNPREVKRLINSALMFGAGALMGSDGENQAGFNQGLQVFFVREILDRRHGQASLLRHDRGQRFFAAWSELVCGDDELPRCLPGAVREAEGPLDASGRSIEARPEIPEAYEQLLEKFQGLKSLLHDKDMGELMRIPYPKSEALVARVASAAETSDPIPELLGNMVQIPDGEFDMGSEDGRDNEKPVHKVKVDRFEMGAMPVTQAQYEAVMGANPSHFKDPDRPVEQVSWHDALEFCDELTKRTPGEGIFTLPSEAQWEYACRAGSPGEYCFLDATGELGDYAWYDENSKGTTHPVGQKEANAFGLYDMHGNVWEWCRDDWHGSYEGASSDASPWGDGSGERRVLRGGSWLNTSRYCRCAFRSSRTPDARSADVGFRVARTP